MHAWLRVEKGGVMRSRFVLAALAGMISIALIGGILYGVLFAGFFQANVATASGVMRTSPGYLWVALAHVPFGVLLTLVIYWRGATSARGGATTGAILGFLMAASYDLSQYGTTNLWNLRLTLVEPFITLVLIGGAGAVVGWVLGGEHRSGVAAE
jgi:hypothetical protein